MTVFFQILLEERWNNWLDQSGNLGSGQMKIKDVLKNSTQFRMIPYRVFKELFFDNHIYRKITENLEELILMYSPESKYKALLEYRNNITETEAEGKGNRKKKMD